MTKAKSALIVTGVGVAMNLLGRLSFLGSPPLIDRLSPALQLIIPLALILSGFLCFFGPLWWISTQGGIRAMFGRRKP